MEVRRLKAGLQTARTDIGDARKALAEAVREVTGLRSQLAKAKHLAAESESKAGTLLKQRAQLREELKAAQAGGAAAGGGHTCPKDGGAMHEAERDGVVVDVCEKCGGIFFDAGEVEQLLQRTGGGGWLARIFGR